MCVLVCSRSSSSYSTTVATTAELWRHHEAVGGGEAADRMNGTGGAAGGGGAAVYEERALEAAAQAPLHIPAKRAAVSLPGTTYPHPSDCATDPSAPGVIRHSHSAQPWNYQPDHAAAAAPFDTQYSQAFCRDGVTPTYYNIADSRVAADRKALAFWPNKYEYAPGPSSMTAADSCQAFAAQTWCNYAPYGRVGHVDSHGQPVPYLAADGGPKSAMEAAGYPHDGYLRNYPSAESMPPAPYPPGRVYYIFAKTYDESYIYIYPLH